MNVHCVNCESIRSAALVRGGGAVLVFECAMSRERKSHLMPGERMTCHAKRADVSVEIQEPTPIYASQEAGR
jgi:hypothetical protein